jgi:hypothetical protein
MSHIKPLYIASLFLMTSCTITFDQVCKYEVAADVIDDTPTTNITNSLEIPIKSI